MLAWILENPKRLNVLRQSLLPRLHEVVEFLPTRPVVDLDAMHPAARAAWEANGGAGQTTATLKVGRFQNNRKKSDMRLPAATLDAIDEVAREHNVHRSAVLGVAVGLLWLEDGAPIPPNLHESATTAARTFSPFDDLPEVAEQLDALYGR